MHIGSLGDAWSHSARVTMYCAWGKREGLKSIRQCQYSKELDLETLICTRRRDFPIDLLSQRLKCPRCGSRRVRLFFSFPTNRQASRA